MGTRDGWPIRLRGWLGMWIAAGRTAGGDGRGGVRRLTEFAGAKSGIPWGTLE